MTIDAVSQTTGVERLVDVDASEGGVLLVVRDRESGVERARVVTPAEAIADILSERQGGPQAVEGEGRQLVVVEVQRNEVLLTVGGVDAAVGLDDLMDAVAAAVPA